MNLAIVIPCYNEELRLSYASFEAFNNQSGIYLIFVDDGSKDQTVKTISTLGLSEQKYTIVKNQVNVGKSESVRRGFKVAQELGFEFVGNYDADGAVNAHDLIKAYEILVGNPTFWCSSGARVLLAGSSVSRTPLRRWAGRFIATLVSLILDIQYYDPQSPCKVYRTQVLHPFILKPSETKWFLDAEIVLEVQKLKNRKHQILFEFPVTQWEDVLGSNLSMRSMLRIFYELIILVRIRIRNIDFSKG